MGTVQVVFNQCLLMLLYLYVGAALFKAKLITPEGSKALANLLLYVVLPCVVVNSFCVEWSAEKALALPVSILAAAAVLFFQWMWLDPNTHNDSISVTVMETSGLKPSEGRSEILLPEDPRYAQLLALVNSQPLV